MFKILDASKHRGGTRVRFVAGERARRDYDWRVKEIAKVSALFSAKPNEIAKAAENFIEEGKAKDQKPHRERIDTFSLSQPVSSRKTELSQFSKKI